MKKLMTCLLLLAGTTAFAENFILDNKSAYPDKEQKTKIALQWAASAKEVDEANKTLLQGTSPSTNAFQTLSQSGKIQVTIPQGMQYFRLLVWCDSQGDPGKPDFATNWIDVVPNKSYTLQTEHLAPIVLMVGMGC